MKKIIVGLMVAVSLTLGLTVYAAGKYRSSDSMQGTAVEKVFVSQNTPYSMAIDSQKSRDAGFTSWPTIFYLYTILIVTAATRRSTRV